MTSGAIKDAGPKLCKKPDELQELNAELGLWLKQIAKLFITCQLPVMKTTGHCLSTWEVMEKLKKKCRPHSFRALKVVQSSVEFIRFEAELESKSSMVPVLGRLDRVTLKLSGFAEALKVKACRAKLGSSRHEWESFFRDNRLMNEMKPGHRPDTIHIQNLPIKWFGGEAPKPHLVIKAFGAFGEIRRFHIPLLEQDDTELLRDPLSFDPPKAAGVTSGAAGGFKRFTFAESLNFDLFIMYRDYMSFVKAMEALRGVKLVKKLDEVNRYLEYDIKVNFDKEKHLSDKSIKGRQLNRKYGIKSAQELRALKEESRRRRVQFEERLKTLHEKRSQAGRLLATLLAFVAAERVEEKQAEERLRAEEQLKRRLLAEEEKLRGRMLNRRREQLVLEMREKGETLKSVAAKTARTTAIINHTHTHTHNNSVLYKNHKSSCKHYKPKSLVLPVVRNDENK